MTSINNGKRNPKIKAALLALTLCVSTPASAQDFTALLDSIEQHSLSLTASQQEEEAQRAEAQLGTALPDPSLGFDYLWSSDANNRLDLHISQELPLPSLQRARRHLVSERERQANLWYLSERRRYLLEAKKLCIEVVYCNALLHHLEEDLQETRAMADAAEQLFNKGEMTAIEHNKAHQRLLFFEAEYRQTLTLHDNLLASLAAMNGGQPLAIETREFSPTSLPADCEEWVKTTVESHPDYLLAGSMSRTERKRLQEARASRLPSLELGYMAELQSDEHYHGLTLGLTLPVWGGRRRVAAAKAHLASAECQEQETALRLTTTLRNLYREAQQLVTTRDTFLRHLSRCDNTSLLQTSLAAGQITVITFLNELQSVHEMHERLLETERDLALKLAEMNL